METDYQLFFNRYLEIEIEIFKLASILVCL